MAQKQVNSNGILETLIRILQIVHNTSVLRVSSGEDGQILKLTTLFYVHTNMKIFLILLKLQFLFQLRAR